MHQYQYLESWTQLLTPEIVRLLTRIHEAKGKQNVMLLKEENQLQVIKNEARTRSIDSSNRIEGITIRQERLKLIAENRAQIRGDNELMLAGYRETLKHVCDNHDYQLMTPSSIIQLHQMLLQYFGGAGGRYRSSECGQAVEQICGAYDEALEKGMDPLLVIPMVVLDFLRLQPFERGNGQMSRLLMLLLLYRAGYYFGKFVSIEYQIEQNLQAYEDAKLASLENWEENLNDPRPFTVYMLRMIDKAYEVFIPEAEKWLYARYFKLDRIRDAIIELNRDVSKQDIISKCPEVSEITIKRALRELVKRGELLMDGNARATTYRYIKERE